MLSTAVGAALGTGVGGLMKMHEEKKLAIELSEVLPPASSAIAVVIDDVDADRVQAALAKSVKKVNEAIDKGDYDKIVKELDKANVRIDDAIRS